MKYKKANLSLVILLTVEFTFLSAQFNDTLKIDYFGQEPPGKTATVFAPEFISKNGVFVQNSCFSQDGKEFLFSITDNNWSYNHVMYTKYADSKWSTPIKIFNGLSPAFSYDNKKIYFTNSSGSIGADVWVSVRNDTGWDEPTKVGYPVSDNTGDEWELSISLNGTLYFSSNRAGGHGNMDLYKAILTDDGYTEVQNLGEPINTIFADECPYIAPDESFMVFNDWKGLPGFAGNNLYVSYKKTDETWTSPIDLGSSVNTNINDIYPYITPDGKYLMYTKRAGGFGATSSMLYWVSTDIIDDIEIPTTINDKTIHDWKIIYNNSKKCIRFELASESTKNVTVQLFDITGRNILNQNIMLLNQLEITMSHLHTGIYLICISDGKYFSSDKILLF